MGTTLEYWIPYILVQWAALSFMVMAMSYRPGYLALRRAAQISLAIEGALVGAVALAYATFWVRETVRERRGTARAGRCWARFYGGRGPRAFAAEGGEVLVAAVPGVLRALEGISGLRRRIAWEAWCGVWECGVPEDAGEWAAWPYRYRDRVRVWAFSAPRLEEVEARLVSLGFERLPPQEFRELVEDWRAFLEWGGKLVAETTREGGGAGRRKDGRPKA